MTTHQSHGCKRRRQDKAAIKAQLVLREDTKGNVGLISQDLFTELFPATRKDEENNLLPDGQQCNFIAIASCEIVLSIELTQWTIVPIKSSGDLGTKTIQFSPSSLALQSFARTLPQTIMGQQKGGIGIMVLDVFPLELDTVIVAIDRETAKKLKSAEGTIHTDEIPSDMIANKKPLFSKSSLSAIVRKALSTLAIIHNGDLFPLPLQPHPITQAQTPPGRILSCEPVGQGVLSPRSKIIVTRTRKSPKGISIKRQLAGPVSNYILEEDEDTSNDQFYSATEDPDKPKSGSSYDGSNTETETETGSTSTDNDDYSDDSMEDMITLQAPQLLATHNLSGNSTMQPGTPLTVGESRLKNGIKTPGSVFSTLTSTSISRSYAQKCLFKTQPLLFPLSDQSIYPQPNSFDDNEARVFIDVRFLTKIGCFSGDWVRVEAASELPLHGASVWGAERDGTTLDLDDNQWRPVKIFGLPEGYSCRPITRILSNKHQDRRQSFFESQVKKSSSPTAYFSPILLANMKNVSYCLISTFKRILQFRKNGLPKITNKSSPPIVRDLGLVKISTPFSNERCIQNSLFSGLQRYFSSKTRVVRQGDFVAIGIDENLARTLYQPTTDPDLEMDDYLLNDISDLSRFGKPSKPTNAAWFRINYVGVTREENDETNEIDGIWGGVVSVDVSSTRISQSGSENCRIPSSLDSPWEFYLGLKNKMKLENSNNPIPKYESPTVSKLQLRLRELIAAATSPRAICLKLRPLAILIHSTQRSIGKTTIAQRAFGDIGLHFLSIDAYDITSEEGAGSDIKMSGLFEVRAERAIACGPEFCGLLIRHIEVFSTERIISSFSKILGDLRVLIATTTDIDKVPEGIRSLFTYEMEMTAPDEGERENILKSIVDNQEIPLAPNVDISSIAIKTAALVAGDLVDVIDRAVFVRIQRLEKLASDSCDLNKRITVRDILVAGGNARCISKADFDTAVDTARKNFADAIGAPKIPNVSWSDVGGLKNVKDSVMETIQLPLEHPELFVKGMKKRSGILFYGPPGTGKTLLAKAIATEFSLNFFSVKGPELLNTYIGESEANVRRVFQRARDARPCVVFFDELDSVAPKRGNQGDSGGVMDRIVSQILAELDGMSDGDDKSGGVFVIGATNRPDLLDTALLRPGRFDKMLYLGVSDTHEKQLTIIKALTRNRFNLHPNLSLENLVRKLPFTYTGADFYALCSDAMLNAVTRQSSLVDSRVSEINDNNARSGKGKISIAYFFDHFATDEDVAVTVTEEDFRTAQTGLIPSVSAKELENYQRVRTQFEKIEDNGLDHQQDKGKRKALDKLNDE
ncbi:Peroxisomal biogenesis factor 6 [Golovinomyces cichoracearum]|uniref:Peroxisomal ATPase PEX6 n=1 Tax=Golovinomyces cichoracearum TaxID=62708 RepID=A0A420IFD6_9PEZI|nr:Peroxisomal biogenesis factor 6 [Golovinomyces cichoracearum]